MTVLAVPDSPEDRRDAIRSGLANIAQVAAAAYHARDWEYFGYDTWQAYTAGEYGEGWRLALPARREAVAELREAGLSIRAIGTVVGAGNQTIQRDLSGVPNGTPDRVVGLDGKSYEATSPRSALYTSDSDDWRTPTRILEPVVTTLGGIDLDPCADDGRAVPAAKHMTKADDGLAQDWFGRIYMNPPYGGVIAAWVDKLINSYQFGAVDAAVALVPARTDTKWMRQFADYPRVYIWGRISFSDSDTAAPFPSCAIYLGDDTPRFISAFAELGDVYGRLT